MKIYKVIKDGYYFGNLWVKKGEFVLRIKVLRHDSYLKIGSGKFSFGSLSTTSSWYSNYRRKGTLEL